MSDKTGRNDPCPCGSGDKYKRCCLLKEVMAQSPLMDPNVDPEWRKIRSTEDIVVTQITEYAARQWGEGLTDEALDDFFSMSEEAVEDAMGDQAEGIFLPWFLFDWIPEDAHETIATTYLKQRGSALTPYQTRFVQAALEQSFTFWVVLASDPGKTITLRDLMLGREVVIKERKASQMVERGAILYARIVELDGQAVMFGAAPLLVPANLHVNVLSKRDVLAAIAKKDSIPFDTAFLRASDNLLRGFYFELMDQSMRPPVITNTDGDPMLDIEIRYRLDCSIEEALPRLASLASKDYRDHLDKPDNREVERDDQGRIQSLVLPWCRTRDRIILGRLVLKDGELTAQVNSDKRAKKLRTELKKRLGDDAAFLESSARSPEAMLRRQNASMAGEPDAESSPEIQELLRKHAEDHWRRWLDDRIPALEGRTPRECARTAEGREKLEALLMSFEADPAPDENVRPDIPGMRRELGLDQPLKGKRKN